jgi:long-chain acyl-CoA synthetase
MVRAAGSVLTALAAVNAAEEKGGQRPNGAADIVELRWNERGAVYEELRQASWSETASLARRFLGALEREEIAPGERVAVLLDNSIEMIATEWACLMGARLWVALNVRSAAAENAAILTDAGARLLVVSQARLKTIDQALLPVGCRVVVLESDWQAFVAVPESRAELPSAQSAVRIRYTSGTSGRPKGAVLTLGGYDASIETVADVLAPVRAEDTVVQVAPMTHASGAMLLPHAAVGARALLLDRFDARGLVALIESQAATAMFLVPTMLVRLLEEVGPGRIPTMRNIVYGGAAISADRMAEGLGILGQVFVGIYGLTESTWPVTALRRSEHPIDGPLEGRLARLRSCGRPTAVGALKICRPDGSECDVAERGQVLVRGRTTMSGYWDSTCQRAVPRFDDESEDTKGLDDAGWMHTGDVAFRDEDGFVTIVDRVDDMIISGGFNIYPREVEDALSAHPAVLEAAVVGRPDPEWGQVVTAFVVCRSGRELESSELVRFCSEGIATYKKPRSVVFLESLPKNAAGKVLRRSLRELASADVSASQ